MIKSCQAGTESYSLVTVLMMCSSYLPGETAVTYETIKASGQRVVGQQSCYPTQDVVGAIIASTGTGGSIGRLEIGEIITRH